MATSNASLGQLEETLNLYFGKKAPQLPKNVKDIVVALAPWLTLVGIVIALPAVLLLFGIGAVLSPFGMLGGGAAYAQSLVGTLVLIVALVLEALAIPGLFARSKKGWRLVYWATIINVVSSLASFAVLSALLTGVVGFYFLFQVKEYYK